MSSSPAHEEDPSAALERLTRWVAAGGEWCVAESTPTSLAVALLTCDRGEEMGRIVSSDPAFIALVRDADAQGAS